MCYCQFYITCKLLFPGAASQKIEDPSEHRLTYDNIPFQHVSMDLSGLYMVKYKRASCKRYGYHQHKSSSH